ncbi:GNAT family N-acetyltransferase [Actinopolymorpha rutila]
MTGADSSSWHAWNGVPVGTDSVITDSSPSASEVVGQALVVAGSCCRAKGTSAIVLLRECVAAEGRWIVESSPEDRLEGRRLYLARIRQLHSTVLVTESVDAIDGVIAIDLVGGVAALGMFVDSASRSLGKGTALPAAAIRWARSQSAHKVSLDVWPHNEPAISLYRRASPGCSSDPSNQSVISGHRLAR